MPAGYLSSRHLWHLRHTVATLLFPGSKSNVNWGVMAVFWRCATLYDHPVHFCFAGNCDVFSRLLRFPDELFCPGDVFDKQLESIRQALNGHRNIVTICKELYMVTYNASWRAMVTNVPEGCCRIHLVTVASLEDAGSVMSSDHRPGV